MKIKGDVADPSCVPAATAADEPRGVDVSATAVCAAIIPALRERGRPPNVHVHVYINLLTCQHRFKHLPLYTGFTLETMLDG